jgi:hypothetical protein
LVRRVAAWIDAGKNQAWNGREGELFRQPQQQPVAPPLSLPKYFFLALSYPIGYIKFMLEIRQTEA